MVACEFASFGILAVPYEWRPRTKLAQHGLTYRRAESGKALRVGMVKQGKVVSRAQGKVNGHKVYTWQYSTETGFSTSFFT